MQKKIIALAVAGLVSGAAFAQSSVTIDGIVDVGYQYNWGVPSGSNTKTMGEVKGAVDGSRVGFHGVEDLGNGLKVGFDVTAGFNIDNGQSYGNALMSEGSSMYVTGANWGTIKGGYFGSFLDSDVSGLDVSGRHAFIGADVLIGTGKLANHLQYSTPDMSGFKAAVGYSSNANGNNQDVVPLQITATPADFASYQNIRAYEIGGIYKNGGLGLGIGYIGYNPQNNNVVAVPDTPKAYEWQAGASYDFKVAAVSLYYAATHFDNSTNTVDGGKSSAWALGVAFPITPVDQLNFSYADRKITANAGGDLKNHAFGLYYTHNLSKRTALYAMYGTVGGDAEGKYLIESASPSASNPAGTVGFNSAMAVGVHHNF